MVIPKTPERKTFDKKSFRNLIYYIAGGKDEEKVLLTGSENLISNPDGGNVSSREVLKLEEVVSEIELNASDRKHTRCKNPMWHQVLSWPSGEIPDKEQIKEAVQIYMKEMNLENCHCFYGVHKNTDNVHLHICLSRVDPETQKVIDPAGGWTRKAGERAARFIEIRQGWQHDNGKWYEVIDGELYEKNAGKVVREINTKAKDFETRTSAKSAERIAREKCAVILFNAKDWNELHAELGKEGCRYEKKGSGAVLFVGKVPVKVSSISQQLSHKKLEKRLGSFVEMPEVFVRKIKEEPLIKNDESEQYLEDRRLFFMRKQATRKKLEETFLIEKETLKKRQRKEREELYNSLPSWKGKGTILNALRLELAKEHDNEWEFFAESKRDRRKVLFTKDKDRWPSFAEWLQEKKKYQEALVWKSRETLMGSLIGDKEGEFPGLLNHENREKYYQIELEMVNVGRKKLKTTVFRRFDDEGLIYFRDFGKRIDVLSNDDLAILDALKLAKAKWGSVTLNGTDKFKQRCMEIAVKNQIEISNPELRERFEKLKNEEVERQKKLAEEREAAKGRRDEMSEKSKKIENLFAQYDAAIGAESYRLTVRYMKDGEIRNWIVDKPKGGISRGFAAEEVKERSYFISKLDNEKKTIYYTPLSEKVHHILIDDVTPENLKKLLADGYLPAAVIMSSPNNFQCILNVPKLDVRYDREIGNKLMRELNTKYGDPKIAGSVHPHRVPGTHNCKDKHRQKDGTFPEVQLIAAVKRTCFKSLKRTTELLEEAKIEEKRREENLRKAMQSRNPASGTLSPYDAYRVHAADLIGHYGQVSNWSVLDAKVAERMYVTGYSLSEIASGITSGSPDVRPADQKGKHNWLDYGKKTAQYLLTPHAQNKILQYGESYKRHWLKLEGRLQDRRKEEIEL